MKVLFDADTIAARVDGLAREIAAAMPPDLTMVVVLKGAFVFAADLFRALGKAGCRPRLECLQLRSYGSGTVSSGVVELVGAVPGGLEGRSVLLVDDIADSGRSLAKARQCLLDAGAAEVRICALLDKPSRREVPIPLDFIGFTVEDVFVVGYGIDHAENHRELPFIGWVE